MGGDSVSVLVPEPHYTIINTSRRENPVVVVANDALLAFPHIDVFPWHLHVEVHAQELAQHQMPTTEESELLFSISDRIESTVLAGRTDRGGENSLFLARTTGNAIREMMFQVHNPDIADQALQALLSRESWLRPWQYEMTHDAGWTSASEIFQLFSSNKTS